MIVSKVDDSLEQKLAALEGFECLIEYDEPDNETSQIIPKRLQLQR